MSTVIEQLGNRLAKMHKHRAKWARRQGITCWRVYDRDMSDQPMIVDWYDGHVICWSMRRTKDETDAADAVWKSGVHATLRHVFGVADDHVWMKRRHQQSDRQHGGQYDRVESRTVKTTVTEGTQRFEINLSDYLDVGLFLDHRPLRLRLAEEVAGATVLNLFCYTGAFSCHAAAGNAALVTSIDLSNTYLDWAERNVRANGHDTKKHEFIKADCLEWLKSATNAGRTFDRIICDPPTFSNSTAMQGTFSIDRDHDWLIRTLQRLLTPTGIAYFSTNSRRFEPSEYLQGYKEITSTTTSEDFREHPAHRCWQLPIADPIADPI